MINKPLKRSYISFNCNSSEEVTGSAYVVHHKEYHIMLDCGMIQGHGDIYSNYQANREQCKKFKPKTIDAILISHSNIDHFGLLPYLCTWVRSYNFCARRKQRHFKNFA